MKPTRQQSARALVFECSLEETDSAAPETSKFR